MSRAHRFLFVCIAMALAIAAVSTAVSTATPAAAGERETVWVETFRNEFINWATPHVDTFDFPPANLYEQINCHITISCPSAPGDCDP